MSSPAEIVKSLQTSRDDLPWYERDLTEFDLSADEEVDAEQTEDHDTKTKRAVKKSPDVCGGVMYPADFWFLLGDYIDPEDVARFALICQGSHVVTHTAGFWQRLYKRSCCHGNQRELPWDLQPSHMDRVHGLRSRVIRYLFHVHPVFLERHKICAPFQHDPDILEGCFCGLMWHNKQNSHWLFNFKFLRPNHNRCRFIGSESVKSKNYRLSGEDDIHVNDHEGSYLMQVVCQDYVSLPSTMGLALTKASLSVSHSMRYHKLRLQFDRTFSGNTRSQVSDVSVVIDPVLNLHILPWWHPKFSGLIVPTDDCPDTS